MRQYVLWALLLIILCGCNSREVNPVGTSLHSISAAQWQALTERSIYFGHQSVGDNVIEGVRRITTGPSSKLAIFSGSYDSGRPGLYEFKIGKNTDPASKNAAYLAAVNSTQLGPNPVLMFKYCWVDMTEKTDVDALFQQYRDTVSALRTQQPEALVVHVTVPLEAPESAVRFYLNHWRGLPTIRALNAKRNRYNDLLRAAFAGKDPIFDLAEVESTHADGSREYSTYRGQRVFALAPEWTSDGGHLNAEASKRAAERLLFVLASLPRR